MSEEDAGFLYIPEKLEFHAPTDSDESDFIQELIRAMTEPIPQEWLDSQEGRWQMGCFRHINEKDGT